MPLDPLNTTATSLSLLERVRHRDQDAWQRLVHIYGPLVSSWISKAGLDEASGADVAQEVWQAVASNLEKFRRSSESGTFRGWVWTITRNKMNDLYRKQRGLPLAAGGTAAHEMLQLLPETEPDDETGIHENVLVQRALELIRPDFEETSWQAFWRMVVDGQPAGDIAMELGLTANAVHQAKFRILKRLREEMDGLIET